MNKERKLLVLTRIHQATGIQAMNTRREETEVITRPILVKVQETNKSQSQ